MAVCEVDPMNFTQSPGDANTRVAHILVTLPRLIPGKGYGELSNNCLAIVYSLCHHESAHSMLAARGHSQVLGDMMKNLGHAGERHLLMRA
eukprot:5128338-Amphidinium_carterae.3